MTATIDYLPIWKRDATPADRFDELCAIARKHPERFNRIVVVYEEVLPNKNSVVRQISANCSTTETLGMLELGKVQLLQDTQG